MRHERRADDGTWLPPVERPSKILATHLTYRSRVEEYRMAKAPEYPSYFLMPPSALSAHQAPVARPRGCAYLNYEGELAVVIGKRCLNVSIDEALDYVRGYTIANDFGVHDFRHADRGAMLRVKGQDGFLPLGPELVPASEFDPTNYTLRTTLNGETVQEATADDLIWGVAYQLADLCRLITLEPGDVVLTGTPAHSRPMKPGDVVAVEIDGLCRLENTVVDWAVDLSEAGEQPETSANTLHVALAVPEDEAERMVAGTSDVPAERSNA
jgi:2-keto-4-pentenoate hydratase/2-oxohepta-3-ene-1,7-dioic acid hydratase in catechol pathway